MSSAHIMNISQTNNSVLLSRVKQLTLQNETLKIQLANTENNLQAATQATNNYAKQFTSNISDINKQIPISVVLPSETTENSENIVWNIQICDVKTIYIIGINNDELQNDNENNTINYTEAYLVINLSIPFKYIVDNVINSLPTLTIPLTSCIIKKDEPIPGLSTATITSETEIPFNLESNPSLFMILESATEEKNIYNLGIKSKTVTANFDSNAANEPKFTISTANWTVQPH